MGTATPLVEAATLSGLELCDRNWEKFKLGTVKYSYHDRVVAVLLLSLVLPNFVLRGGVKSRKTRMQPLTLAQ